MQQPPGQSQRLLAPGYPSGWDYHKNITILLFQFSSIYSTCLWIQIQRKTSWARSAVTSPWPSLRMRLLYKTSQFCYFIFPIFTVLACEYICLLNFLDVASGYQPLAIAQESLCIEVILQGEIEHETYNFITSEYFQLYSMYHKDYFPGQGQRCLTPVHPSGFT